MHMSQIPQAPEVRPVPLGSIRTGLGDGCIAHFHPELYQLVLRRDGYEEKVELGFSGSRLLERLMREPGEVVARDELLSHAWSDRVVGQGSLNQQIYTLRQVLGDEKRREIIQTLPRRGYMLNPQYASRTPPPEAEPVAAPEPLRAISLEEVLPPALRRRPVDWFALATPLLLIALSLAAALHLFTQQPRLAREETSVGNKHFIYLDADHGRLRQLRERTAELSVRLAAMSTAAMNFTLSRHAGFYEIACSDADGATRLLVVHQDRLASLDTGQLRSCLP